MVIGAVHSHLCDGDIIIKDSMAIKGNRYGKYDSLN